MRVRTVVAVLAVLAGGTVCARLGVWQLSRLHEKQRLNAGFRAALSSPPIAAGEHAPPIAEIERRRVTFSGAYDSVRHVLLAGRPHDGAPGLRLVTPLRLAGGVGVLVDRGWLASADAATARPEDFPEPDRVSVTGIVSEIPRGVGGPSWRPIAGTRTRAWSVRRLDLDSLAARVPYPLAPYLLTALPESGVAARSGPLRVAPEAPNESMHLSYAIQWFLFGSILVGGSLLAALRSGRPAKNAPDAMPEPPRR